MSTEPHAHDQDRRASPASRARARCTSRIRDGERRRRASCASTSRRASSRRSCAAARYTEAPDITARICGICPVAYQMSAVRGDGGRLRRRASTAPLRALRRLLYCGEWIESHALHVFMLHAPDFLGYDERDRDGARPPRASSSAGLRMKKAGNELMPRASAAARSTRSTCASAASTARRGRASCARCVEQLERARELALETVRWTARLRRSPTSSATTSSWRSRHPDDYPIDAGRIVSSRGPRHRARRVRRALRRGARARTRTRCTRGCASAAPTSSGRSPATRSTRTGCRRSRARPPREAGPRRRSAATRSRASSCAASRCSTRCDEALRDHRRLRASPTAPAVDGRRRAPAVGYGCDRGAARHALPPLRARRRRHDPRGADRPADLAEPAPRSRRTCARFVGAQPRPRRRRRCGCAASRRSATTTPASPARRTSSTLEVDRG